VLPAACQVYSPYPDAATARITAPNGNDDEAALDFVEYDHASGGETTHISVADGEGNAVSVTVTNSSAFGAHAMVGGFWLNDSGWWPRNASAIPAQLPSPWRTRITTIAPSVLLKNGEVELVVGSPGGGRIPFAIAQTVAYAIAFGLDPMEALRMPRMYPSSSTRVEVEAGFDASVLAHARAMGYEPVNPAFGYARVYMISRRGGAWVAAADPRHDGEARAY